jgi:hypothetical protein
VPPCASAGTGSAAAAKVAAASIHPKGAAGLFMGILLRVARRLTLRGSSAARNGGRACHATHDRPRKDGIFMGAIVFMGVNWGAIMGVAAARRA